MVNIVYTEIISWQREKERERERERERENEYGKWLT